MSNLEVSEQLLTGESVPGSYLYPCVVANQLTHHRFFPVSKTIDTFDSTDADLPIADRVNLCYASTIVTKGRGSGITIGTGMNTQVSIDIHIARDLHSKLMVFTDWAHCKRNQR